ncbi:MAG TPA: hypothetical protein PKD09_22115, partial [Aggregatilinea sp.]|uniref:hypothetical protein n=1 Tax=Aggregatilinea sp. TaxID=2806333 RepID=UPI002B8D7499
MPRARIGLRERSQAIILLYRLPAPLLHPLAVLYALVGGAAVGIGTGMALIVAGVIGPHTGPWALRLVMVGASVVGAALLYGLVYLPG